MRSFNKLSFLAILSAATSIVSAALDVVNLDLDLNLDVNTKDGDSCLAEICAGPQDLLGSSFQPSPTVSNVEKRLTNAERFARHLPPASPRRRFHGSRVVRDVASPAPSITKRGYVKVISTENGQDLGYISKSSFSQAQYRYQPNLNDALIVNFGIPEGSTFASSINVVPENSDISNQPFSGLIQGRDNTDSDIAPGSFHYGYIAGTHQTSPSSPPDSVGNSYTAVTGLDRTSESSVWSYDVASQALHLQWVNTDGSKPATILFSQSTALYFSGDSVAFNARFPADIIPIALAFVEI